MVNKLFYSINSTTAATNGGVYVARNAVLLPFYIMYVVAHFYEKLSETNQVLYSVLELPPC